MASRTSTRYTVESLFGLLFEIAVLSECNYLVCTFSSQVSVLDPSHCIGMEGPLLLYYYYCFWYRIPLCVFNSVVLLTRANTC